MQDEIPGQTNVRHQALLAPRRARAAPSSSRMLASYLSDIERLLEEQRWDAAQREALDVPRLAVALADAQLQCSAEQVDTWCQEWLRPSGAERDAQGVESERLMQQVQELLRTRTAEGIPMRALRRLQLRRHLRVLPRGFPAAAHNALTPAENTTQEICSGLLEAARRWYARTACHDPVVQANLARLAVLR
jgi:hypothetical protein